MILICIYVENNNFLTLRHYLNINFICFLNSLALFYEYKVCLHLLMLLLNLLFGKKQTMP